MACRDLDFSWKEPFRDSSRYCDNRSKRSGLRSPYHRHQQTTEHSWMDGGYSLPWITEKLRRRRVQDGDFCVWKARGSDMVRQTFHDRTALLDF
eukprot:c13020_g1_i1 orf=134-415(+)